MRRSGLSPGWFWSSGLRKKIRSSIWPARFFFVLGGWWLADAIQPAWQVFQGVPGIVLKVIAGVVLVILAVQFYRINARAEKPTSRIRRAEHGRVLIGHTGSRRGS